MTNIRNKWDDARKRMEEGVESLLCFDHGLTGVELHTATAYLLDEVIRPEFEKILGVTFEELWSIKTINEDFKIETVESNLSKSEGLSQITSLSKDGIVRRYWLQKM